ncbi:MAG: tetratricopeptide repeat protein, partial [Bacteroidota bacterium]
MKRVFTAIFLLSLMANVLIAKQVSTDSLRQVINTQTGEEKVNSMNQLVRVFIEADNLGEAEQMSLKAMEQCERVGYQLGLANAYDNMGLVFQAKFDYTNAMKQFVEALKIRNKVNDQKGIAASKNNIGKVFYLQEDIKSAIENLNAALDTRKQINDMEGAAETHKNLADVFLFKKLYGKAKEHYRQSMEIKIALNDLEGAASIASFLGNIVSDLGDDEGALVYHHMSLDLNNSTGNMANIAQDYTNIALAYQTQEIYDEALDANETAYTIRKKLGDKFGLAMNNKIFGLLYVAMENFPKAEVYLEKSAALLKEIGTKRGASEIYKDIANAYMAMDNFARAYQYQVAFSNSRDHLYTEEKSRALLELTTKYESEFAAEKQSQRISALEKDQAYNAKFRYFLFALLGLGLMLIVVLFTSFKRKQRDNQLLVTKNTEIQNQKEEIDLKNGELEEKNASLDLLNQKLVQEMAERESIEKSSFARDRFLATMSHEMRTPMNIIIGLTHLLLEDNPREDQAEHLRTLQFSANNLVVFINDVLDFSKIEAGKLNLESRIFDPVKTFDDVKQRFRLPAKDKSLEFKFNIDRKIPDNLMGDPTRLNQIVTNLVSNAIQYTDEGAVNVAVQLKELTKKEAVLYVEIADTGNGIAQDKLDEMFRPFSQNHNDAFEGYETTGLGLAITKRLVDLQNGNIEVVSEEGKGTKFILQLPFKVADEAKKAEAKNQKPKDVSYDHLADNKILLVEDNRINQLVVAKMLRKLGMEVVTADNGFEALDAFEDSYFDLVLMDIQMPGMDGYRATAEIRKSTDPRKRDVPIIALTASAFLTEKEKAKLFGMNDHVGKPFGPDDLLEKISNCL